MQDERQTRWMVSHELAGGLPQVLAICQTVQALTAVVAALMSPDVSGPQKLVIERASIDTSAQ